LWQWAVAALQQLVISRGKATGDERLRRRDSEHSGFGAEVRLKMQQGVVTCIVPISHGAS